MVAPLLQKVPSPLKHLMIETGSTGHFGDEGFIRPKGNGVVCRE
jgi:hypothetical protein